MPLLSVIINQFLQPGVFPDMWKEALPTPVLNKYGSDLALENFRPRSNLQFVSKLVERAAADQLSLIWLRVISFLRFSRYIAPTMALKQP